MDIVQAFWYLPKAQLPLPIFESPKCQNYRSGNEITICVGIMVVMRLYNKDFGNMLKVICYNFVIYQSYNVITLLFTKVVTLLPAIYHKYQLFTINTSYLPSYNVITIVISLF